MPRRASKQAEALRFDGYIPGLDVLRGLAVLAVLGFHGFANGGYVGRPGSLAMALVALATQGKLGVYLFFMLSGFLISSILLKERDRPAYYRNFYIRRALRILPAYLLMLVVLKAAGLIHWSFVLACVLFIANMGRLVHSNSYEYGVFWTLAVEEQFYLLWPTFVRRLRSPRMLLTVILAGCVAAPLLRVALHLRGVGTYLLLPTNMDALLYGAMGTALIKLGAIHRGNIRSIYRALLLAGGVLLLPYLYVSCFAVIPSGVFWAVWDGLGRLDPFCLFAAGLLFALERAQSSTTLRGAVPRGLAFAGYLSYGLYLVHPLAFAVYDRWAEGTALGTSRVSFAMLVVRFCLVGTASVVVAWLSRRYYEQLFLSRKKQLAPYRERELGRAQVRRGGRALQEESLP